MPGRRITIVLPFVNLTGGVRMMLDHANALQRAGHRVLVTYPAWPYRFHFTRQQQIRECRGRIAAPVGVPWFDLEVPIRRVPIVRGPFLPPADIVIGTSWPTAFDVARLPASRGRKVQVLMHHEAGTGPLHRIEASHGLPVARITLSHRIRKQFERDCGVIVDAVVPAGVDPRVFYPEGQRHDRTVLMLYHPDPRKGAADGLEAIARVLRAGLGVRAILCGALAPPNMPQGVEYFRFPTDDALRRLYSQATVLLYPSRYEGFGLPPLEAMACGCPVVTTAVGAVPEYAVDGRNATVVPLGDPGALANALERVIRTPSLQRAFSEAGRRTAAEWTSDRAAVLFERALERITFAETGGTNS